MYLIRQKELGTLKVLLMLKYSIFRYMHEHTPKIRTNTIEQIVAIISKAIAPMCYKIVFLLIYTFFKTADVFYQLPATELGNCRSGKDVITK